MAQAPGPIGSASVDRSTFLELYLIRHGLVQEPVLERANAEFEALLQQQPQMGPPPLHDATVKTRVPLWTVSLRLRFLELVQLGLTEPSAWSTTLQDQHTLRIKADGSLSPMPLRKQHG